MALLWWEKVKSILRIESPLLRAKKDEVVFGFWLKEGQGIIQTQQGLRQYTELEKWVEALWNSQHT